MKRILKTYPVVSTLSLTCLLLGLLTSFYGDATYDLLAFHSKPAYAWQYVSGTLMHGSKGAPVWFLWVHLILNGLMVPSFGGLLERKRGSRQVLIVFVTATALSSIVFHLLTQAQDIPGNRDLCCRLCLCNRGSLAPAKYVERVFTLRKTVLSILSFSIWLHALTGHHRLDLDLLHLSGIASYLLVFSEVKA